METGEHWSDSQVYIISYTYIHNNNKTFQDLHAMYDLFHSRLGLVPVKEASIVVAISSEHRKESLEAVHLAIDALASFFFN